MERKMWLQGLVRGLAAAAALLCIMTGFRLAFFLAYRSPEISFADELSALVLGARVDLKWVSILLFPAWLFWLLGLKAAVSGKIAKVFFVLGVFLSVLLDAVNFGFYGFYRTPISSIIFGFLQDDTAAITKTILSDWPVMSYLAVIAIATGIPLFIPSLFHARVPEFRRPKTALTLIAVIFTVLLGIAMRGSLGKFPLRLQDFSISPIPFVNATVPNGTEALYVATKDQKALELKGGPAAGLRELGFADPEAAERALKELEPQNPAPVTRDARQPNVIFALMESMGRDEFDSYDPKTNDTLGALAGAMKSGYVFHQGIPVGNGTFVSLEGLLYDSPLSPISQSRYGHEQFPFSNVLAFRRAGYRTIFLTSCTENWRELNRSLPLHGFDEVIGASKIKGRFPEAEMGVWGVGDKWTFRYAKELLEKASKDGKPVFLMILSATNHPPHHLPDHETGAAVDPAKLPPFLIQKPHDEMVSMLQTYSYAANALGNFVEGVRSEPWGKNTLIAATGDHNARFSYQPNGWYHHANGVPILFWLPDGFKPAAVPPSKQWVSHRVIFPTLRGIALGEKPALYQGRDIFEPGIPDAADTFTGIGKYGYAIGNAGAAGVDGSGKLLCFRWQGDRLITSSCTPELRKLGTIAAVRRALSDYTVRSALLHEKAEKRLE